MPYSEHTRVGVPVVPVHPSSPMAVAWANHIKGGLHIVANLTERDAIPEFNSEQEGNAVHANRRTEGLHCYVIAEKKTYRLEGGVTNDDWVEVSGGFDGAVWPPVIDVVDVLPESPEDGDRYILTTDNKIYTYSSSVSDWVEDGTTITPGMLAIVIARQTIFMYLEPDSDGSVWVQIGGVTDIIHDMDDPGAHRAAENPVDFGKFFRYNPTTGNVEKVKLYLGSGLISGGAVVWTADMDFDVYPAYYIINGIEYTSGFDQITLDEADPVLPRIDAIVVDQSGNVVVIAGIPATNPVAPMPDPFTQVLLTTVLVQANMTDFDFDSSVIYDEDEEWVVTSNVSIDTDSETSPKKGTYCIDVGAFDAQTKVEFASAGFDPTGYKTLVMWIKLKEAIDSNTFSLWWERSGTFTGIAVRVKPKINISSTDWQPVIVSMSEFRVPGLVDKLVLSAMWYDSPDFDGLYIDDVYLIEGIDQPTPTALPEFREKDGKFEWKYTNEPDSAWRWIFDIPEDGEDGAPGADGQDGAPGTGIVWQQVSSAQSASNMDGFLCDTSESGFTITLPASPSVGNTVGFADAAGAFGTNNLTIDGNGNDIQGSATDLIVDINYASFTLVYTGDGWNIETYLAQGLDPGDITGPPGAPGSVNWSVVSSNSTIAHGEGFMCDTSGGAFTVTLPVSPSVGDTAGIKDKEGTFDTNAVTIARNGKKIQGLEEDMVMSIKWASFLLIYTGDSWNFHTFVTQPIQPDIMAGIIEDFTATPVDTGTLPAVSNTDNVVEIKISMQDEEEDSEKVIHLGSMAAMKMWHGDEGDLPGTRDDDTIYLVNEDIP